MITPARKKVAKAPFEKLSAQKVWDDRGVGRLIPPRSAMRGA
jgi:hypothetical protein